jgi:hypothetical protein
MNFALSKTKQDWIKKFMNLSEFLNWYIERDHTIICEWMTWSKQKTKTEKTFFMLPNYCDGTLLIVYSRL